MCSLVLLGNLERTTHGQLENVNWPIGLYLGSLGSLLDMDVFGNIVSFESTCPTSTMDGIFDEQAPSQCALTVREFAEDFNIKPSES